MRLVLTHAYFLLEDPREREIMRPYPPLGLLYISAWLKENGYAPTVLDSTFMNRADWMEELCEAAPDVVACYANLMTKVALLERLAEAKKRLPNCRFVVGGPDVTYNVENYLRAGFDFVISGEGEQSLLELVEAIDQGQEDFKIPGVSYLTENSVVTNEARSKIRELSSLPFPDRDAIPLEKYLTTWKTHHGQRTVNISTQRGCPYTCKWCSTAVYGQSYRRNDPDRVVAEILDLKARFQAEALWFVDDVFTVSHKWIKSLHAEFKKHDLTIAFECISRAERLNDEILELLKEMGCFRIWIGAESGSQRIIDKMDRRVELTEVQAMIQRTQAFGMEAGTFLMVGYPEENHEDIRLTMEHLEKAQPTLVTITRAYPIKGTALYHELEAELTLPNWITSTDRDIQIPVPYSDRYYQFAIRYLINGWKAKREGSMKHRLKSRISYQMMRWNK